MPYPFSEIKQEDDARQDRDMDEEPQQRNERLLSVYQAMFDTVMRIGCGAPAASYPQWKWKIQASALRLAIKRSYDYATTDSVIWGVINSDEQFHAAGTCSVVLQFVRCLSS